MMGLLSCSVQCRITSLILGWCLLLVFLGSAPFAVTAVKRTTTAATTHRRSSSDNGAPWQSAADTRSNILEEARYSNFPPTVFSPTGRLHPVERVVEAAKDPSNPSANLLFAIKCPKDNTLIVVSTLTTSPHLNITTAAPDNSTNVTTTTTDHPSLFLVNETACPTIFDLTPTCIAATAGNTVDGHALKTKLQSFAEHAMDVHIDDITSSVLARRVADHLQIPTQTMGGKGGPMLASHAVILGNGEIWRIDPTGQFWKCRAVVLGRNAEKAEAALYKQLTNDGEKSLEKVLEEMTCGEALDTMCGCMNEVLWPEQPNLVAMLAKARAAVFWQAVIVQESSDDGSTENKAPKRIVRRGAFLPPKLATAS